MKDIKVLVLNKFYFPIAIEDVQTIFGDIFSGSKIPLHIEYEFDRDSKTVNLENIDYFTAIDDIEEWLSLNIREYDEYIHTARGPIRIPPVVICSTFDKVIYKKVQFPTKQNIFKRDNYTCVYTGKKLSKDELSVDHVIPRSKGGTDTWENLVTCDRLLNSMKGSKTLTEAGLKLRYKPYKPSNGLVFDIFKDDWSSFLKNI
jgi:5-methylcytosine-specific restriction endonuclease McrA